MQYTETFRARMVRRMLGPKAVTATELAKETGVSQPTLSRWLRETASVQAMSSGDRPGGKGGRPPSKGKRAQDWSPEEKLRAVVETMAVSLACGDKAALTLDPREGVATMTAFIVRIAKGDVIHGSTEFNSLFAVGLTLFLMTLAMNGFAQWISNRYRMVYQ